MSQDDLADALKVTQQTVSRWETGESLPKPGLFMPLSRVLECSLEDIIGSMAESTSRPPKPRAAKDRLDALEDEVKALKTRVRRLEKQAD